MSNLVKATSTSDKVALAHELANAQLLPKAYQKNPANLLYAIEYAEALGISPISAVTSIHVIDGKPTASAQLIAGLGRRAGHKVRVAFDPATKTATAQVIRKDDPDFVFESVWTMARAQGAGLTGKDVWRKYPDAMLKARAITEVARDAFPEALFGVVYTAEELGAVDVDEDGAVLSGSAITTTIAAPSTDPNPKVSAQNIERFKGACAEANLDWRLVADGIDMDNLRESDMNDLRAAFKRHKEQPVIQDAEIVYPSLVEEPEVIDSFQIAPGSQPMGTQEFMDNVIDMFDAVEVPIESIQAHPANGTPKIKEPGAPATAPQIGKLKALCMAKGIKTREDQQSMASDHTGRKITSFNELTKSEASELIGILAPVSQ
jgi:hypothetical protein